MQVDTSSVNLTNVQKNPYATTQNKQEEKPQSVEESIQKSAVSVQISMNAQIVLFSMDTQQLEKGNSFLQASISEGGSKDVLDFLSGKTTLDGLSLKNIGYEGKPITQLSAGEANDLLSENGFFGIKQTSDRVANFVLSFSQDNVDILKEGREGVVKGFEEAEKLFGGELPEISYKTQERTLQLIDEKIAQLEGKDKES